jgi:hypothetical protein
MLCELESPIKPRGAQEGNIATLQHSETAPYGMCGIAISLGEPLAMIWRKVRSGRNQQIK